MAKTVIEEFIATLGMDIDTKSVTKAQKVMKGMATAIGAVVAAGSAIAGGLLIGLSGDIAKVVATSKALGVSAGFLENLGNAVKPLGFDFENVSDIIEEMTNKINEFEESAPVKESFGQLGLVFEDIKKLKPEAQFKAIADAALNMQDAATARSAVDTLMGGEANKIFGFLKSTGMSMDEIIAKQEAMNFQNDESRESAAEFNKEFRKIWGSLLSFFKLVTGKLAKAVLPFVKSMGKLVQEFKIFIDLNGDEIFEKLNAAFRVLVITLGLLVGGLIILKSALIGTILAAIAMPVLVGLIAAAVALLIEDFITFITHGNEADTLFGRLSNRLSFFFTDLSNFLGKVPAIAKEAFDGLVLAGTDLIEWLAELPSKIIDAFLNPFDTVLAGIDLIREGFMSLFSIVDKVSSIGVGIVDDVKGFLGIDVNNTATQQPVSPASVSPLQALAPAVSQANSTSNSSTNTTVNNTNTISVNGTGMEASDVADEIESRIAKNNSIAVSNNDTGSAF